MNRKAGASHLALPKREPLTQAGETPALLWFMVPMRGKRS